MCGSLGRQRAGQGFVGDGVDDAAQQCDDGSFPAVLDAEECAGDVDSTAFALSALTGYTRSSGTALR